MQQDGLRGRQKRRYRVRTTGRYVFRSEAKNTISGNLVAT
jgi:hypothetical protein